MHHWTALPLLHPIPLLSNSFPPNHGPPLRPPPRPCRLAAAATCSDGKRNGDERRADCGGSCDPCPGNNQNGRFVASSRLVQITWSPCAASTSTSTVSNATTARSSSQPSHSQDVWEREGVLQRRLCVQGCVHPVYEVHARRQRVLCEENEGRHALPPPPRLLPFDNSCGVLRDVRHDVGPADYTTCAHLF